MFSVIGAKALQRHQSQSFAATPRDEAVELVGRYPNLSEIELARLINSYRELSALDMALMLSDESLAPKLDRFSSDHRSKIRTPFRQYAALVGYAVVAVIAVAWAAAVAT
jgi:hypothetical protein